MTRAPSTDLARALADFQVTSAPDTGLTDRVGEIYVMVTWRCNLRCVMCPMWGEQGFCREDTGQETLTPETVMDAIRSVAHMSPRALTVSGGEPLLNDVWLPITRQAHDAGLRTMLTTNATMLKDLPPHSYSHLRQVNISLDGPPLVLERMGRGGQSTIDRAIEGLRHMPAGPSLKLLTVITPDGVGHLIEMLDLFEDSSITFSSHLFQHQMFLAPPTARSQHEALQSLLGPGVRFWDAMATTGPPLDVDALLDEISRIRRRLPHAVFSPHLSDDEIRRYYTDPTWTPRRLGSHCLSPWLDVLITPDGDVWLCPGFPIGNIHHTPLADILNREKARTLRRAIATDGTFPGCRACFYLYNYRLAP